MHHYNRWDRDAPADTGTVLMAATSLENKPHVKETMRFFSDNKMITLTQLEALRRQQITNGYKSQRLPETTLTC